MAPALRLTVLVDQFPALSETFVTGEVGALLALGHEVAVEAPAHPRTRGAAPAGAAVHVWEDERLTTRALALARLVARHPVRCAADLLARRTWRREEHVRPLRSLAPAAGRIAARGTQHLHAHFAAGAGLDALRLGRILGLPYSVTAHAYDIYLSPANLPLKLREAAFATTGCEYTARTLRELAPEADVRVVIMGVDAAALVPAPPRPDGGRAVVSVGRLVPKKGFADLVRAAALLRERGRPLDRLTIAGSGPLHDELVALATGLGVAAELDLPGPVDHAAVPALVAGHDLFALPCVVAPDGDRDSMPVVVKEALALEVPAVVTDEVGLPELVHDGWGRRVPPHDPAALADALDELLALPAAERRAMGARGRAFVAERCDIHRQTAALAERMAQAVAA